MPFGAYTHLRCLATGCPGDGKCLRQSYYVQGASAVRIAPIRKVRTRRLPSSNDCARIRRHVRHGVTVCALSGLAGVVCSTLGIFYMLQAFLKASLIKGLILGLGITQLATPIAWQLSSALLDLRSVALPIRFRRRAGYVYASGCSSTRTTSQRANHSARTPRLSHLRHRRSRLGRNRGGVSVRRSSVAV